MNCDAQALLRHFTAQLGALDAVEYSNTPWQSATFNGARHCFAFTIDSAADIAAFVHSLPEAEIPLPGGFVADALVTGIGGSRITAEALVITAA